jgi:alkaline phosphatase
MNKAILSICMLMICLFSCKTPQQKTVVTPEIIPAQSKSKTHKAKNIILLIGDGMGLGQVSAGMFANGNKTALEEFNIIGLHKPYASNKLITDSAAAATSFASGIKTYNGAIGVDENKNPVGTILEEAEQKNYATGLVASSTIVHATPASFIAHNEARKNYEEIAEDFLDTEVDIFIGGGLKFFNRRENDDRNLVKELEAKGYTISDYFQADLAGMNIDKSKNFGYLTADEDPLPKAQGRDYLPIASEIALNFLDDRSDEGFFLMIEGSQIDWGGHANKTDYIISEFLDFDQVIAQALAFAKKDKETLVVVTADHETGGFAIQPESTQDSIVGAFTSNYHTGTMVPVYAYGPQSALFGGIYENIEIYHKMREAFGWEDKTATKK